MAAIDNIKALNETLNKDKGVLSTTEKADLNKTNADTYKKLQPEINKQEFEMGTKKTKMKLEDIVKNFNTVDNTVTVGKEKVSINRGSDLGAWIQIFLIANGQDVYFNKPGTTGKGSDIDGKIGEATKAAIRDYKKPAVASNEENNETGVELKLNPTIVADIIDQLNNRPRDARVEAGVTPKMKKILERAVAKHILRDGDVIS